MSVRLFLPGGQCQRGLLIFQLSPRVRLGEGKKIVYHVSWKRHNLKICNLLDMFVKPLGNSCNTPRQLIQFRKEDAFGATVSLISRGGSKKGGGIASPPFLLLLSSHQKFMSRKNGGKGELVRKKLLHIQFPSKYTTPRPSSSSAAVPKYFAVPVHAFFI